MLEHTFSPVQIGSLTLPNRLIKAATFEGMCPSGSVSQKLLDWHRAIAAGGVAMTTLAYGSVSKDGQSYPTQILVEPSITASLAQFARAIHDEGALASIQLGHCGYFANSKVIGTRPIGPSRLFNTYGLCWSRSMTEDDMQRVEGDFVQAALVCKEAGFDAIEIHCGHGYLLSQFISPFTNRRKDQWGIDTAGRLRFPQTVIKAIRSAVGPDYPILLKVNVRDGFEGGLELEESLRVTKGLVEAGADAVIPSGGFVSKAPLYMLRGEVPLKEMVDVQTQWHIKTGLTLFGKIFVQEYPYEDCFFIDAVSRFVETLDVPVVGIGGITSVASLNRMWKAGAAAVQIGRALIHDPKWPQKIHDQSIATSGCVPCNACIAEMDRGGVACTRDPGIHPNP